MNRHSLIGLSILAWLFFTASTSYACNTSPTAVISVPADPCYICVGGTIEFDGSTSHDNDEGGLSIVAYSWDLDGNGTFESSGAKPSKTYNTAGQYTVKLKVRDDENTWSPETSCTVYVVEVAKLQYDDPLLGYTDVPETLCVHQGTSVTFKAIPNPAGASWPTGKPIWKGEASGTGPTTSVTFDTLSTSASDYNQVTAECANEVTANVIVYDFEGELTPDVNFAGRSYSEYGVEETVSLSYTINPSGVYPGCLKWKWVSGVGDVDGTTYDAEAVAGYVTLRLEVEWGPSMGRGYDYSREVVEPSCALYHASPPYDGIWHEEDSYSCGFKGEYWLSPENVSFTNIEVHEANSPPADMTGHYVDHYGSPDPCHPYGEWRSVEDPDPTYGSRVSGWDTCNDDHTYCSATLGDSGTFSWTIPVEYHGDDWERRSIAEFTSSREMKSDGTCIVGKGCVGPFEKEYDDPDSEYYTD